MIHADNRDSRLQLHIIFGYIHYWVIPLTLLLMCVPLQEIKSPSQSIHVYNYIVLLQMVMVKHLRRVTQ